MWPQKTWNFSFNILIFAKKGLTCWSLLNISPHTQHPKHLLVFCVPQKVNFKWTLMSKVKKASWSCTQCQPWEVTCRLWGNPSITLQINPAMPTMSSAFAVPLCSRLFSNLPKPNDNRPDTSASQASHFWVQQSFHKGKRAWVYKKRLEEHYFVHCKEQHLDIIW